MEFEKIIKKWKKKWKDEFVFLDESGFTKDVLIPMLKEAYELGRVQNR